MTTRRLTSTKIVLTTAFLALAAGGTAACDASRADGYPDDTGSGSGFSDSSVTQDDESYDDESYDDESYDDESYDDEESEDSDEVFYCADEDGLIAEEQDCVDDPDTYYLWHSPNYSPDLSSGDYLDDDDGDYFTFTDRKARKAFKLPATGTVRNGTVKTNVVGAGSRSGSGNSGTSGG